MTGYQKAQHMNNLIKSGKKVPQTKAEWLGWVTKITNWLNTHATTDVDFPKMIEKLEFAEDKARESEEQYETAKKIFGA